jgi:hypothetical protein
MSEITPPGSGDGIEPVDLRSALEERYLAYALSTIMHRALPDVARRTEAGAPAIALRHADAEARSQPGLQEVCTCRW